MQLASALSEILDVNRFYSKPVITWSQDECTDAATCSLELLHMRANYAESVDLTLAMSDSFYTPHFSASSDPILTP